MQTSVFIPPFPAALLIKASYYYCCAAAQKIHMYYYYYISLTEKMMRRILKKNNKGRQNVLSCLLLHHHIHQAASLCANTYTAAASLAHSPRGHKLLSNDVSLKKNWSTRNKKKRKKGQKNYIDVVFLLQQTKNLWDDKDAYVDLRKGARGRELGD